VRDRRPGLWQRFCHHPERSPTPATIDRLVVAEDIRLGQLVRAFDVSAVLGNGSTVVLAAGASIGAQVHRRPAGQRERREPHPERDCRGAPRGPRGPVRRQLRGVHACDARRRGCAGLVAAGVPQPPPRALCR